MPYWAGPTKTVVVVPLRGDDGVKRTFTPEEWRSYFGLQDPFLSYMEEHPKDLYTQEDVTAVYRQMHTPEKCPMNYTANRRRYEYGYTTKNYFTDW